VAIIAFSQVGSWQEVRSTLDPMMLSFIQPADDPFIPWPTPLISLSILGFYFMCSNQHMVQRVLGTRSLKDGRKGAVFAALLKLPLLSILVMPGVFGQILYPEIENPNLIFPELMFDFLPAGVLGLILTGFIAALMSSIDSALTAASSIATMDIYRKFKPGSSQKQLLKMGKIFILAAVTIASVWAPVIDRFPTLWEYLQAVLSFLSPPVVTCYLSGLFWDKATAKAAFYSLIAGSILAGVLIINNYFLTILFPVHYLYSATIIFLFSSVVMVFVSLRWPEGSGEAAATETESAAYTEEPVWYKNHKLFAIVVLILTILLVWKFW
jgi:solute:Na+ symporter, SSS family